MDEELTRKAAERLWSLVSPVEPTEDIAVILEDYTWVVTQLAQDPDFRALVLQATTEVPR